MNFHPSSSRQKEFYCNENVQGVHMFFLVFSLNDRKSFESIRNEWKDEIDFYQPKVILFIPISTFRIFSMLKICTCFHFFSFFDVHGTYFPKMVSV